MKRILCSLLVATLPFGGVLANAPKSKDAKVTLVYQHELPNGRVATSSEQRMRFIEPSFSWRIRDHAAACERRSHSSKPMRPRRASPNGTSERSSTRPPQYPALGSRSTSRRSPTALR